MRKSLLKSKGLTIHGLVQLCFSDLIGKEIIILNDYERLHLVDLTEFILTFQRAVQCVAPGGVEYDTIT